MTVAPQQRHTKRNRCPICGGADQDPRGQEKRCSGFNGSDGLYAHCSREELAGGLSQEAGGTFAHKLRGECKCGQTHGADNAARPEIVATYDYTDEGGALLFQCVRFSPKGFRQRRPDGAGWIWNMTGVRIVPYRLRELLADDGDRPVYIVEGEKDADALWKRGHVATCNPMGAGKFHYCADTAKTALQGRDVIVIADDDPPDPKKSGRRLGHDHARDIEATLHGVARSVRVTRCPKHKDVSDHFAACGEIDQLVTLEPCATPGPGCHLNSAGRCVECGSYADGTGGWSARCWDGKGKAALDDDPARDAIRAEGDGGEWPDPIAFDAFDVPAFPVDSLPAWMRQWCEQEATALQVPVDLPAMLALAVVSLCIAKKIAVRVKPGWVEPTNVYTAIAMLPGEGKTPVFVRATAAVRHWETEQRARLTPQIAAAEESRHLLDERIKQARARAARGKDAVARQNAEDEARELAVKLSEGHVPVLPRLIADDATPEAVGRLLAGLGGRLGIFSSEGGPFAILAGRYSESPNLELFCKAYSGDPYTLDRIGRPSIRLDSPLLTIALTVQPSVIAGLAATPAMRGQGFLARILYSMPQSMVGRRLADPEPVSGGAVAKYDAAIHTLLALDSNTDERGELATRHVTLTDEARAALIAFKAKLEPRLGPSGDLHTLADWGNKLTGTVARIACVLHAAEHYDDGDLWTPVTSVTMRRALAIGEYAIEHARAAFSVMGSDPATELAKRAWTWIARRSDGTVTVTRRELHRGLHVPHAADLDAPLKVLVERGYLRELPTSPTGGRPSGRAYEISPRAKR